MHVLILLVFLPLTEQYMFLSAYGDPCDNYTECKDHRMICSGEESNRTCTCVKYHEWKGVEYGCVQMYDGEKIMRLELRYNNMTEEVARAQEEVFNLQIWAGAFVVAVCTTAVLSVMLFCLYIRTVDGIAKKKLHELQINRRRSTLLKQKTVEV